MRLIPEPFDTQAFNRYTYCLNNPIVYNDPSGQYWEYDGEEEYWEEVIVGYAYYDEDWDTPVPIVERVRRTRPIYRWVDDPEPPEDPNDPSNQDPGDISSGDPELPPEDPAGVTDPDPEQPPAEIVLGPGCPTPGESEPPVSVTQPEPPARSDGGTSVSPSEPGKPAEGSGSSGGE